MNTENLLSELHAAAAIAEDNDDMEVELLSGNNAKETMPKDDEKQLLSCSSPKSVVDERLFFEQHGRDCCDKRNDDDAVCPSDEDENEKRNDDDDICSSDEEGKRRSVDDDDTLSDLTARNCAVQNHNSANNDNNSSNSNNI